MSAGPSRPRPSLRAILDAAGRTPPDVAARIGIDVAAALGAERGERGEEGTAPAPLDATRIEVGTRGEVVLAGLGVAGRDAKADVRALGVVLHECLSGEPPGDVPRPLDVPGVPPALAAVVDRATGAASPPHENPAGLAAAIAGAVAAPATASDVAAYADAVLPPEDSSAQRARSLDSGQIFPAPLARRPPSRWAVVVVAMLALALGFALGVAAQRAARPPPPAAPAPERP